MATYKEIKGVTVQTLDADPVVFAGTWSSGGSVNTGRAYGGSAGENNESAMYFGGYTASPDSNYANTEQYNGTAWTEVNDLSNARMGLTGSFGTYTAAVAAAGDEFPPSGNTRYLTDVEEWDGSSWSEGGDLPTATNSNNGAGTQTAGIIFGGNVSGNAGVAESYEYNGSSWTAGGDMNTARNFAKLGCGTQTASLICGGGDVPGYTANTELYDGSSWTEVNNVNNPNAQGGGGGTQTSAITARGQDGTPTQSESWDGTSWTITADTSTDAYAVGGVGASSKDAAIYAGYDSSPASFPTATEEFSFPPPTAVALTEGDVFLSGGTTLKGFGKAAGIPAATWSSGGTMNTARAYGGAFGTQTAGLVAGGETSTAVNTVEQYNGTSWTEITEINTTRYGLEGFGDSYTSGFVTGGAPDKTQTESWNGSAWTEVSDLPQGTERGGCAGTSTAAFYVGGYKYPSPAGQTNVGYDWDGSSWSTGNNINTSRDRMGAAGVITSGIVFGGTSPSGQHNETELYDGSSWTETNNLNTARRELGASTFNRTNSLVLGFGGEPPSKNETEIWNGSSWTEINNLSTARAAGGGLGTSTAAAFAGGGPPSSGATEEFTADNALATVTVS